MIKAAAYDCESLRNPTLYYEVYNMISPQRQAYVDKATSLKVKCERLGASHILEKLLWENHIQRPYEYGFTEQGKPILVSHKGIYFSLTHSKGVAAAVISDHPCGIDIEKITVYKTAVAKRFFTRNDVEFLEGWEDADKPRKFMEVWTFKEALAKMMDRPLTQILPWIDFHHYSDGCHGKYRWTKLGYTYQDFFITI